MSRKKSLDVIGVIERAKIALRVDTDRELGELLGVRQNTVSMWRTRGGIDLQGIIELCPHVRSEWLLYGAGEMNDDHTIIESKIVMMMDGMTDEQKRDILRYIQKEKYFCEVIPEYLERKAG